jgi:Ni/Fe-hydrogenase b-type cytochrome subunit
MTNPAADKKLPGPKGGVTLAHTAPPPTGNYQWVYLWEVPVRTMHWVAALCIVTLAITGLYIGKPYFLTGGEASSHFLMGKVRLIHFIAAGLLVATGVVRIYWLFAGNQFERLTALFPVRARDWKNMWLQVKHYMMIEPDKAPHYLGHNPMQQLSYTGIYLLTLFMVVSGFALYGEAAAGGFFQTLFTRPMRSLFGGIQNVRFLHHVCTWAFAIFFPMHIYLAMRADLLERTGTISSIISGGRWVPKDQHFHDAPEDFGK